MKAILAAHYDSTMHRIERERCAVVLAAQDTTSFNYSTHDEMEVLGPIGSIRAGPQGVMLHDTMVYDTDGTALGLIDAQVWARNPKQLGKRHKRHQRPIDKRESIKWLRASGLPPGSNVNWEKQPRWSVSGIARRMCMNPSVAKKSELQVVRLRAEARAGNTTARA